MSRTSSQRLIATWLVAGAAIAGARLLHAQGQPIEFSNEARFQLDLQVSTAAVTAMLPPGFALNVSTQGASKDCNLRLIFVDRFTINAPDGKPVGKGSSRVAYLNVPVKDQSGTNSQLVVGGLVDDPADAPGPLGVFLYANTHTMQRTTSTTSSGTLLDTQDWVFQAPTGEHLEMHIKYDHGFGNKGNPSEVKYDSGKNPGTFQIWRQEQILDILRNPTTNPPDKVKEFSFKGSGGSYAKLFDGTEKVVSWDNVLWLGRTILQ